MHARTPLSCNINFTFVILKVNRHKIFVRCIKERHCRVFFSNSQPFYSTTYTFIFDESQLFGFLNGSYQQNETRLLFTLNQWNKLLTVCHWFSYHVLLLPVFKVKYPPPSSLENFISLNSQIRILKPEKGIGATKPPALETPLDPLPEF